MQEQIKKSDKEQENFRKVQLDQELTKQMKDVSAKKQAEKKERKELVLTSGGPTQYTEDTAAIQKKFKD